jgi:hypothetical protein
MSLRPTGREFPQSSEPMKLQGAVAPCRPISSARLRSPNKVLSASLTAATLLPLTKRPVTPSTIASAAPESWPPTVANSASAASRYTIPKPSTSSAMARTGSAKHHARAYACQSSESDTAPRKVTRFSMCSDRARFCSVQSWGRRRQFRTAMSENRALDLRPLQ